MKLFFFTITFRTSKSLCFCLIWILRFWTRIYQNVFCWTSYFFQLYFQYVNRKLRLFLFFQTISHISSILEDSFVVPPKKGRGRPRKYPLSGKLNFQWLTNTDPLEINDCLKAVRLAKTVFLRKFYRLSRIFRIFRWNFPFQLTLLQC